MRDADRESARDDPAGAYAPLLAKIEEEAGFRGSRYRQRSLRRRLAIRMRARGAETPGEYAGLLDRDPDEYRYLLRVLTINVSRFFRNPGTWEAVRREVLPAALRGRPDVTFWSAATGRGEEAYTAAILLREHLEGEGRRWWPGLRVVGTDIDEESLAAARRAVYPAEALEEVPPGLRRRWFEGGPPHRVAAPLPSLVEFAVLDLLESPPDFVPGVVFLRNLLIYLERDAQREVFDRCASVLGPGGFLVLGKVETIRPGDRERFAVVNGPERIYRKR